MKKKRTKAKPAIHSKHPSNVQKQGATALSHPVDYYSAILNSYADHGKINHIKGKTLPSRRHIYLILRSLRELLFPGFFEEFGHEDESLESILTTKISTVRTQLAKELNRCFACSSKSATPASCDAIVDGFFQAIPEIRALLSKDLQATLDGDPAATCEEEVIIAYPGFQATMTYRIAHYFYQQNVPLIPRIMTEISHSETGIDIHPGATIGEYFCIDHGTGIVIGETAIIGQHVKLYQGVTIGALSVSKSKAQTKRHPTIEDHVTIYARTTILGGNTVIGKGTVIGGNVWLLESTPPYSKVYLGSDLKQIIRRPEDDPCFYQI